MYSAANGRASTSVSLDTAKTTLAIVSNAACVTGRTLASRLHASTVASKPPRSAKAVTTWNRSREHHRFGRHARGLPVLRSSASCTGAKNSWSWRT